MIIQRKYLLTVMAAFMILTGCDAIHEFSDDEGTACLIDVNLDIDIDMNFEGEISPQTYASYSSMLEGDYDIRYIVEIYKATSSRASDCKELIARIVRTNDVVVPDGKVSIAERLRIQPIEYIVLAWVDFVRKGSDTDLYYNTGKLTSISTITPNGGARGYNTTKDAFCGSVLMDLRPLADQSSASYTAICPALRPMAMYQIITTDIEKYVTYNNTPAPYSSIRPNTTNLLYQLYFPMGYNVQFEEPKDYQTGIGYQFDITEISSGQEAIIASDFVFVSSDTFFYADFEIRDAESRHINTTTGLKINLKRNMVTIIRGEFLTRDHNSSGIGISDKFSGDEIIVRID